jgi:diacylglycerol kinase (ATP)
VKRLWRATLHSWHGLLAAIQSEAAFRQELILLAIGVPLAFYLTDRPAERLVLIGSLFFILIIELLNSAIERLSDRVTQAEDPILKRVKDMGSAAMFLSLLAAGAVWIFVAIERLSR